MCIDIVEAQRAVDKYCDMYPAFQDTRECKLLRVSIKYAQAVCIRTSGMVCHLHMVSLLCRFNLTSVSNTNIHVLGPNGLSELPEVHFEFPFILIGKMTMDFLRGQSWRVPKSWYTGGDPEQGFQCCFTDKLNQSLVWSVALASTWSFKSREDLFLQGKVTAIAFFCDYFRDQ